MSKENPVFAVDFDGVIAAIGAYKGTDDFQGEPNKDVITVMKALKGKGWRIIIYTCRPATDGLIAWLTSNGVPFDDINRNSDAPMTTSSKVQADIYLDDRAVNFNGQAVEGLLTEIIALHASISAKHTAAQ